jgi:hypothetical protein
VSDIDTVVADSLKALDPEWPIREADIDEPSRIAMGGNSLFSIRAAKSLLSNLEFQCRKTPRFDDGNRHRNIRTPSDGNHHY